MEESPGPGLTTAKAQSRLPDSHHVPVLLSVFRFGSPTDAVTEMVALALTLGASTETWFLLFLTLGSLYLSNCATCFYFVSSHILSPPGWSVGPLPSLGWD